MLTIETFAFSVATSIEQSICRRGTHVNNLCRWRFVLADVAWYTFFLAGAARGTGARAILFSTLAMGDRTRVNREQATELLRNWAARASSEAQEADTREDVLSWQGQAQVLSAVATYLAGPGSVAEDAAIWKQVIADRQSALGAWQKVQEGPEAMLYSGMVAGYDVALTALADLMGRGWEENKLIYG